MEKLYENLEVFRQPVCVIRTCDDGSLAVQKEVIEQLAQVEEKLSVVAITGLYRTGKSYLLNRLAGVNSGFPLGSGLDSKTKGIWIWCRSHPTCSNLVLVLLDTEGLGDVNRDNRDHDHWIFTLATLLSSTLVYNVMGVFDSDAVDKLNFVTEMSKRIKAADDHTETKDEILDLKFPTFIVTLRDFSLRLELNGQPLTSDQYLEQCLVLKEGDEFQDLNSARQCIRRFYKVRKCFTFDRPAKTKDLPNLETLSTGDLDEEFLKNTEDFSEFVFNSCSHLVLANGHPANGRTLGRMIQSYVEAIRQGAIPCVKSALATMTAIENRKAVDSAVKEYRTQMNKRLTFPTPNTETLSNVHEICLKDACDFFLITVWNDEDGHFLVKVKKRIDQEFSGFREKNRSESEKVCKKTLQELKKVISHKVKEGQYCKQGGFLEYQQDMVNLKHNYDQKDGLGEMAKEMFDRFQEEQKDEMQLILSSEKEFVEKEKALEAEKTKGMEMASQLAESTIRVSELRNKVESLEQFREREKKLTRQMQCLQDTIMQLRQERDEERCRNQSQELAFTQQVNFDRSERMAEKKRLKQIEQELEQKSRWFRCSVS